MREVIQGLMALQKIDEEIHGLNRRRAERPARAREAEELSLAARARVDAQKARIRDLQKAADAKEIDLREREAKIEKLEIQLNQTKNQKDYDAVKHQMSSYRADNSVLEDEILRIMSEIDALKSEMGPLDEDAARRKTQFDEISKQVAAEVAELDRKTATLRGEREERAKAIPADALERYSRIVQTRDGVGLATVVDPRGDATCGGCHMSLTLQQVASTMKGSDLVQCKACGRILYIS